MVLLIFYSFRVPRVPVFVCVRFSVPVHVLSLSVSLSLSLSVSISLSLSVSLPCPCSYPCLCPCPWSYPVPVCVSVRVCIPAWVRVFVHVSVRVSVHVMYVSYLCHFCFMSVSLWKMNKILEIGIALDITTCKTIDKIREIDIPLKDFL
jgi:hypothetical protein